MNDFICDACGQIWHTDQSSEEALTLTNEHFGVDLTTASMKRICGNCAPIFIAWYNGLSLADRARIEGGGTA